MNKESRADMSLRIEQLQVELQQTEIIHKIDLEIKGGEFISLLGPSGCGKTTLLKCIAGLLPCQSGELILDGSSISNLAPEHRGTIIVFQDLRLFPHMTVEKNIAFPMELQKVPKARQKEIVRTLLQEVQLQGFEKRKIKEMSGGQRQRIALARALAASPKILLLDEPFSGLDERLRQEMGALVKKIQRERKITTVLVTHDKREALQMSDRIALMKDGLILQYDKPQTIFYHPNAREVADYFGKVNYIRGTVEKNTFKSAVLNLDEYPVPKKDGMYEVMIHPMAVEIKVSDMASEAQQKSGFFIREMTFMGETAEVALERDGVELTAVLDSRMAESSGIVEGKMVELSIDTSNLCFFEL